MAAKLATRNLIFVIGDEDTVSGLLLGGIGHQDAFNQPNYFIVDQRTSFNASEFPSHLVILGTTNAQIEEIFHKFTTQRRDSAIVLMNQHVAQRIRWLVEAFQEANPFPSILEIPSKEHPYDPEKDSMMKRVQKLVSSD